jgi:hypothetical protein
MIRALQFLRDMAAGIDALNSARISAHRAEEQRPGVDDRHGGQHQRGGKSGFHFLILA